MCQYHPHEPQSEMWTHLCFRTIKPRSSFIEHPLFKSFIFNQIKALKSGRTCFLKFRNFDNSFNTRKVRCKCYCLTVCLMTCRLITRSPVFLTAQSVRLTYSVVIPAFCSLNLLELNRCNTILV